MKKLFSLFCAALIALSAAAVPVRTRSLAAAAQRHIPAAMLAQPKVDNRFASVLSVKPAAQRTQLSTAFRAPADASAIVVSNITSTSADVTVTPSVTTAYFWAYMEKTDYDDLNSGAYASDGYADIAAYMTAYVQYYIDMYEQMGVTYTFDDFTFTGVSSETIDDLDPSTEYIVFALAYNAATGAFDAPFATETFTTLGVVASDLVLTLTYDAANAAVSVNASNSDQYIFVIETQAEYDYYQSAVNADGAAAEALAYYEYYEGYGYGSYLLFNGSMTVTMDDFFDGDAETGDYIAVAVPYQGAVNGTGAYVQFHYDAPAVVVTDTVNLTIVSPEWADNVTADGWWQIMGAESTDTLYYVSLSNSETTQVVGTYTKDDMDLEYSYVYDMVNAQGTVGVYDITVTITADATISFGYNIHAEIIGKNGILYIVDFVDGNAPVNPDPENPDPENPEQAISSASLSAPATKALIGSDVVILRNGVRFNLLGSRL